MHDRKPCESINRLNNLAIGLSDRRCLTHAHAEVVNRFSNYPQPPTPTPTRAPAPGPGSRDWHRAPQPPRHFRQRDCSLIITSRQRDHDRDSNARGGYDRGA